MYIAENKKRLISEAARVALDYMVGHTKPQAASVQNIDIL